MRRGDYQKSRVYAWERSHVSPHDKALVPFDGIQAVVNHIWASEGLLYPPRVAPIPKQKTKAAGDGCRLEVRFHEHGAKTWVIIHELAHAMTMGVGSVEDDPDGYVSCPHGPEFVGVYMRLLEKYLKLNLLVLMHTAKVSNVDFDITARITCLDA